MWTRRLRPETFVRSHILFISWPGPWIALDTPVIMPFPVTIVVPALPISPQITMRYRTVDPIVASPIAVIVIPSPSGIHVRVKDGDSAVKHPPMIIITGTVPTSLPGPPPPAVPKEKIYVKPRYRVNTFGFRQWNDFRWVHKRNRWWQTDIYADVDSCHRLKRGNNN